jgi:VWFA-related protein
MLNASKAVVAAGIAVFLQSSAAGPAAPELQPTAQTQPATEPKVVIIEPTSDAFLSGPVTFKAAIEPPGTPVTRADFFVDGVSVCRLTIEPFECQYDAGFRVQQRQVRVAMTLADGRRFIENVRTQGIELADTIAVNAVLVPVVVRDWRGKFVPKLTKESFRLLENGTPQTISFFQAENIALELSVAVDISDSMTAIIRSVKESLHAFLDRLKPIDRVTLLAFNERVFVGAKSETDRGRLHAVVDRLSPQGGTAIYDALVRSADSLGNQISRRAIVAFSDGKDEDSLATMGAVEDRFRASDVSLYLIIYGKFTVAEVGEQEPLVKLAQLTGGRAYRAEKVSELSNIFRDVIDELSQHYLLGYSPLDSARDGAERNITVSVPGKNSYELRFRNKYQTGK